MAYAVGLKESARSRIEAHGRVELTDVQAAQIWHVKRLTMYCMPIALVMPLPFFMSLNPAPAWASML